MRTWTGALYWAATGAMLGLGLIGLMSIGLPFLLAGAVMVLVGLILFRTRGIWAFLAGFGGLPALLLTSRVLIEALRVDWSCSSITLGNEASGYGYVGPDGEEVICETLSVNYLVVALPFWSIALLGLTAGLVIRRLRTAARPEGPGATR